MEQSTIITATPWSGPEPSGRRVSQQTRQILSTINAMPEDRWHHMTISGKDAKQTTQTIRVVCQRYGVNAEITLFSDMCFLKKHASV